MYEDDTLTQEEEFELLGMRIEQPIDAGFAWVFDDDDLAFLDTLKEDNEE